MFYKRHPDGMVSVRTEQGANWIEFYFREDSYFQSLVLQYARFHWSGGEGQTSTIDRRLAPLLQRSREYAKEIVEADPMEKFTHEWYA